MNYDLSYTDDATEDIRLLKRNEPSAYKKLVKLLIELMEHPETGTGKPEQLRGNLSGMWSRRITDKHRLVYEIHKDKIDILIVNAHGIITTNKSFYICLLPTKSTSAKKASLISYQRKHRTHVLKIGNQLV